MKKALILHGWGGNADDNWFPWIKEYLEKRGYEVCLPDLPNTNYPVLEEQLQCISGYKLEEGDLLVGHSLGCQLGLKYVEEHGLQGLNVIFVAPTYNELGDELGETILGDAFTEVSNYYNERVNFFKLNRALNSYIVMLSDDDPYINSFSAKQFYGQLDRITFVDFEGKGHFNSAAGIWQLPEVGNYL